MNEKYELASVEEALEDLKAGKFVVVVDDEDRENEGDLVMAAQFATPESVNFMLKYGRGVLCTPGASGGFKYKYVGHTVYGYGRQTRRLHNGC